MIRSQFGSMTIPPPPVICALVTPAHSNIIDTAMAQSEMVFAH
jgi:hypothetical protein